MSSSGVVTFTAAIFGRKEPPDPLRPFDALAAAQLTDTNWISTPNQCFVPEPPLGTRRVYLRADARFGLEDFTLYPQIYSVSHPHLIAIPTRAHAPQTPEFQFLWENMNQVWFDFDDTAPPLSSLSLGKGRLSENTRLQTRLHVDFHIRRMSESIKDWHRDELKKNCVSYGNQLKATLNNLMEHLEFKVQTWKLTLQTFTNLQRTALEICGLITYMTDILPRLNDGVDYSTESPLPILGAFTTRDVLLQRFFRAGVPVWFIRSLSDIDVCNDIYCDKVVPMGTSCRAVTEHWEKGLDPFPVIFEGSVEHKDFIDCRHEQLVNPLFSVATSRSDGIPVVSRAKRGRRPYDRPAATTSDSPQKSRSTILTPLSTADITLLPPPIEVWSEALLAIDISSPQSREKKQHPYCAPVPDWFVGIADDRQRHYFLNWLAVREAWLNTLSSPAVQVLSASEWKSFLSFSRSRGPLNAKAPANATANTINRFRIQQLFASLIGDIPDFDPTNGVRWCGSHLYVNPETDLLLQRAILWELAEINFRFELQQLDQYLSSRSSSSQSSNRSISPIRWNPNYSDQTGYFFDHCPKEDLGLGSHDLQRRIYALEGLRKIVVQWPNAPFELRGQLNAESPTANYPTFVRHLESKLASFYCKTFVQVYGRAPVLPRRLPVWRRPVDNL
ncbi:hypothetical protein SISNIDRAFT_469463 [Sistotremastrum niveocremeum HHB9708]|uniref:Uncharacterized protein n=2 Tax=Sistotremastraceae TaxID=3402574 RepID=A0A164PZC1_9AGAM|nr:hypothetical protein SISNIDRAFT_469463 [Sistotremastrum niveocremeum HHB9708]KZT33419.1 hypothetical protein SISSUDRAFT_1066168 [Sistotremastrum suecicum HHB10207 ss-3]